MENLGPRMFIIGETYVTHAGDEVTIEAYGNDDTSYECVKGSDDVWRYNRRDYGRTTGTDFEVPDLRNLEIPADKRNMITWLGGTPSLDHAKPCTCGSVRLVGQRDKNGDNGVFIRCLSCGCKSVHDSNLHNCVNYWNDGDTV